MANSDRITVYIGTYTRRESFVDGKAEGIYVYHLDPRSGELTHSATVTGPGTLNPSYVTLSPDRHFLYAVNEVTGGRGPYGNISAFAVDPLTGDLKYLNQQSTHGLAPCFVSIEPEGRYCLVANYETGSVCVLPVKKDGSLGPATGTVQCSGSGPNRERQEGPHAHMILPGPGRRFIHAPRRCSRGRLVHRRADSGRSSAGLRVRAGNVGTGRSRPVDGRGWRLAQAWKRLEVKDLHS